jgi:hypothetical protein
MVKQTRKPSSKHLISFMEFRSTANAVEILESLGLDAEMMASYEQGETNKFLELRETYLAKLVNDFLISRTERDLAVRPSISDLLIDE